MNAQFALALLRHPAAKVDTLLECWAKYLESADYQQEKARAQKVDESNAAAVDEKNRRKHLTVKVHRLRHQDRQAPALHRNPAKLTSDQQKELYQRWCSGRLSLELERCTRAHGYGKLPSTGEILQRARLVPRQVTDRSD